MRLACMMHVSHSELLMRPQIAPTRFHDAFADADKRIYMSATPGDGGEFERAFGRHKITRIPVPANCETQGTGRRLLVFPDLLRGLGDESHIGSRASRCRRARPAGCGRLADLDATGRPGVGAYAHGEFGVA